MINKFIALLVIFQFSNCVDNNPGSTLAIRNNTDSRLFIWHPRPYSQHHFPDTLLPVNKPGYFNQVPARKSSLAGPDDPNWNTIYNELPQQKLSLYFFTVYPENQAVWDSIRAANAFVRKDISLEELQDADYEIAYP